MTTRAADTAPAPVPLTGALLWIAAACLSSANLMSTLDTTIANVSLPHIAGALAVSPSQGTWVITSYGVSEAITVPLTGWLAQRFGPAKVFLYGVAGFGICSVLCGLAPTFGLLVFFRVLQGFCGGPLMPMSQTLLLKIFPPEKRAQGLAIWSMTVVVGPILGPIFGGLISDNLGWSWIFYINVPIAIVIATVGRAVLTSHDTPGRRVPVDYVGLGLLVIWVGSLQIMLDRGRELEWFSSLTIVALALAAAIGFCAFLIWELTAENPIVNLRIFRHRGFTGGVIAASITFGAYFASVVLIPLWLQTSMGYTASQAGFAAALNGGVAVFASPIVARLAVRVDPRKLVTLGVSGLALVAFWRAHFDTDVTFWNVALPFAVQGLAVPFFFVPMTSISIAAVLPEETASAAGLQNFLRTTSAAFATSLMTTSWDNVAQARRYELAGRMHDVPGVLTMLQHRGLSAPQATGQLERLLQTQSVMLATDQMFLATMVAFAASAACVWIAPRAKPRAL